MANRRAAAPSIEAWQPAPVYGRLASGRPRGGFLSSTTRSARADRSYLIRIYHRGEVLMSPNTRPLAIVTGASSGIGYELARCCAENGFDLLIAADQPAIRDAAQRLASLGVNVETVDADL